MSNELFTQWEIVNIRVNWRGTPVTLIAELRLITEGAYGKACKEIVGAQRGIGASAKQ